MLYRAQKPKKVENEQETKKFNLIIVMLEKAKNKRNMNCSYEIEGKDPNKKARRKLRSRT